MNLKELIAHIRQVATDDLRIFAAPWIGAIDGVKKELNRQAEAKKGTGNGMRNKNKALAEKYADDVDRMHACLAANGQTATDEDIVLAWQKYSESLCATWLDTSKIEDDASIVKTLREYLSKLGAQDHSAGNSSQ